MADITDQAVPVSGSAPTTPTTNNTPTDATVVAESREEKLRKAKIAMEGFDRTVKREAIEKEEEASGEKQKINKILISIDHEKELLELTWVNLDDKRSSLKKVLEPVLAQEDAVQSEETQLESKEDITMVPTERKTLEEQRWQVQEKRRKIEEEKWLIEDKITKIEAQIEEVKKKYQTLLAQEEENRRKIQAIDEQIILQQEVLRQQHDLEEQKKRQEALKQAETERIKTETERQRAEVAKKAEEAKKLETNQETKPSTSGVGSISQRIEQLRRAEEARQKQETSLRADELKPDRQKTESAEIKPTETAVLPPTPKDNTANLLAEKQAALRRSLELERVRRENEEAELARQQQAKAKKQTVLSSFVNNEDNGLKPLRTLKGDLDEAVKNQQVNSADLDRASKKTFPWLKEN